MKFVLKAKSGSRKQFLIMESKVIMAFAGRGKKFTACSAFNDITSTVTCKTVDGLAAVDLSAGATGAVATTADASAITTAGRSCIPNLHIVLHHKSENPANLVIVKYSESSDGWPRLPAPHGYMSKDWRNGGHIGSSFSRSRLRFVRHTKMYYNF